MNTTDRLDTRKLIMLSTAHLRRETAEDADAHAAEHADRDGYESHPLNRVAYGYLFCVCGYPYTHNDGDPDELEDCANYVGTRLFKEPTDETFYILFDCDGFTMEGLPAYDWE